MFSNSKNLQHRCDPLLQINRVKNSYQEFLFIKTYNIETGNWFISFIHHTYSHCLHTPDVFKLWISWRFFQTIKLVKTLVIQRKKIYIHFMYTFYADFKYSVPFKLCSVFIFWKDCTKSSIYGKVYQKGRESYSIRLKIIDEVCLFSWKLC